MRPFGVKTDSERSAPIEFSAVIPAYNRADTIGAALGSVLEQEPPAAEVIVVDDGSQDGTADVVRSLGVPVQLIRQANAGASEARNTGVRAARSRWIAFLDSDDVWLPGHLQRMRHAICATQGKAVFYFADTVQDPLEGSTRLWARSGLRVAGTHEIRGDGAEWALLPIQPMMLQSAVFDRAAYRRCGGLRRDLRSRHDTHLFLVMALGQPVCAVAGCGVQMTADARNGRVTTVHGSATRGFWEETVVMYEDVLAREYPYRAEQHRALRERICVAHLRLARFAKREGRAMDAVRHVVRAARRHPGRFVEGLQRVVHLRD